VSDESIGQQLAELTLTVHEIRATVNVALTQTQARIDEHGRLIGALDRDHLHLSERVRTLETASGGGFARLEEVERAVRAATAIRPPQWPTVVSTITGAITLLLVVAGLLYLGPQ
jgi:hypothetical protein